MSSATYDIAAMRNVGPSSATVWRHLLWKDVRQVWQLFVGITVMSACFQLLIGVLELLSPVELQKLSLGAINIALAGPTLLAIACSGVLIGQERQTGCWAWNSSLPVSWRQSLISKTLIWLATSVATVAILLIVAAIVLAMNHTSLALELFSKKTDTDAWTQAMTVIIAVQVFVYFSGAVLLIKDTLLAIVVAAFVLCAFHFQVAIIGIGYNVGHENKILWAYCCSIVVGAIGLAATYRWRWGAGQYAQFSMFGTGSESFTRPQRAAWQYYAGSATQPSELGMLMHHGLRSSFWLRAITFCGALAIIISGFGPMEFGSMSALLASCVLGVSVFSGEQTSSRYRFFADRGVDWKRLLVSHIASPALMVVFVVSVSSAPFDPNEGWFFLLCIPVFVVGMFSSLVFASPIISITIAIAALVGAYAFTAFAFAIWRAVAPGYDPAIVVWLVVSTLLVLVMTIRQVPHWLTKDRFNATGLYVGTMLVAALLPCVLGLSFGFLQIPNVAWQGTPLEQIKGVDLKGGPELKYWNISLDVDQPVLSRSNNLSTALVESQLSSSIQHELHKQVQDLTDWFSSNEGLLESIENGSSQSITFDFNASHTLDSMIQGSAILALMATEQRQKDLAIRAWRANRKLIAFCQQPALLPTTMRSVAFVWEIWNTLDDDDLQFLLDTNQLQELVPNPGPNYQQFKEVLRARGTLHRIMSNSHGVDWAHCYFTHTALWEGYSRYSPLKWYPPIRWAYERQHASALNEDLGVTAGNSGKYNRFNDPFKREYAVLTFLERSFAGRISQLKASPELDNIQAPKSENLN